MLSSERTVVLANRVAVDGLRRAIARERELYEVRRGTGSADWTPVTAAEPFHWGAPLPLTGAKRFFFPQREPLVRWQGEEMEETIAEPPPFALFGLRSCDIAAIAYQDRFFASHPWYVRRREGALLVGVNCVTSCARGFCHDVDAGPFAGAGFDLNLTPLPDGRVVVELGHPRGRVVLDSARVAHEPLDRGAARSFAAAATAAVASFTKRPFIARAVGRINDPSPIPAEEWHALGPSCFACSGCTNLCPTCSCFTVVDEGHPEAGERVRYWDSCLLEGFQREASGHHPAPRAGDRVRRFWQHKFSDDFAGTFGRPGCVGCGRCDVTCAGSIGALRVLAALGALGR